MTNPLLSASSVVGGAAAAANQPPAFRATGRGLQNDSPRFFANSSNANGIFTNLSANPSQYDLYKLYAFVHEVETGWSLSGNYGQGNFAKTFYPQNLQQDDISVIGQCPSQFEYDKLVSFVEHSHRTILSSQLESSKSWIDFKLLPHTDPPIRQPLQAGQTRRKIHHGMHYGVVITTVEAGHERFNHQPLFRLTCKVLNDYVQPQYEVDGAIYNSLVSDYIKTFGDTYTPAPGDATTEPPNTTTTTIAAVTPSGLQNKIQGQNL